MDWFAINDTELRQFHMAGLVAGGGDAVLPVVNMIRDRKISYTSGAEKPTANKQIMPCRFINTDMCHAKPTPICRTGIGAKKRFGCYRSSTA
jgi:hypothetical protein